MRCLTLRALTSDRWAGCSRDRLWGEDRYMKV